jgi:hypothetical protein
MNLVHRSVSNGGRLAPLVIRHNEPDNTGIMNPSIFIDDDGDILINIRVVNYTLYISENEERFFSPWGPLTYLHPEKDQKLKTVNYFCRLDQDLNVINTTQVEMMNLHTPIWEFHGLEDARVVRWDGDLYLMGVRRDTTPNGQGRMEYSRIELDKDNWTVKEVSRVRMPSTGDDSSYCDKNYMPIIDQPYHLVKWTMPTEIVWSNPNKPETKQTLLKQTPPSLLDQRGGSHVIRWGKYYIAITHEVRLWRNYLNQKDSIYRHRLVVWDSEFNFKGLSKEFSFMDVKIEFCVGLAAFNGDALISFSVADNAAFVLQTPKSVIDELISEALLYGS